MHHSLILCFQLDLAKESHKQDVRERARRKERNQGFYCPIPYYLVMVLDYTVLLYDFSSNFVAPLSRFHFLLLVTP